MKNKIYHLVCITFLLITFAGCNDFLEVENKGSMSPAVFPTSVEHLELMLNASYAGSHTAGLYAFNWLPMGIYLYDKTSDMVAGDARVMQTLNQTNTDNIYIAETYYGIFKFVEFSNAVLDGIIKYQTEYPEAANSTTESKRIDYIKGQALFNRALAYWHGQIFFELESKEGSLGLPIFRTVPKSISEMTIPRSTTVQCWDFIIETLNEAIPLLTGYTDTKTGRVTEYAAKGLLAKAYMQARRWEQAEPVLKDIIDNSGKRLVPYTTYANMFYGDENGVSYDFNNESLFEIDMSNNPAQTGHWDDFTTGSNMPNVFAPWAIDLDIMPRERDTVILVPIDPIGEDKNASVGGGWGNNYIHDGNIRRFGFTLPTPGNKFLNPDFNKKMYFDRSITRSINNYPFIIDSLYQKRSIEIRENKEADPRLYIACGQPYVDTFLDNSGRVTYYDKPPGILDRAVDRGDGVTPILGWSHKKFTNRLGQENAKNHSSDVNYPVIRMADIYLLYAEVLWRTEGDLNEALEYINKVHRRAYGYDPETAVPGFDYTDLTNERTIAQKSVDELQNIDHLASNPLLYERWAELFAEGQWWFDIRRWEILEKEMMFFKETRNGPLNWTLGIDHYVQPIPKTEIERCEGRVIQSGNY